MHRLEHLRTFGDKSCTFELTVSAQTGALAHFWRQILHFRAHRKCTDWSTGHGFGRQQCHAYAVPAVPLVAAAPARLRYHARRVCEESRKRVPLPLCESFSFGAPPHIFSQTISAAVWAFELLYRGGRGRGPKTGGSEAAGGGGGDGCTDVGVRGYYYNE